MKRIFFSFAKWCCSFFRSTQERQAFSNEEIMAKLAHIEKQNATRDAIFDTCIKALSNSIEIVSNYATSQEALVKEELARQYRCLYGQMETTERLEDSLSIIGYRMLSLLQANNMEIPDSVMDLEPPTYEEGED